MFRKCHCAQNSKMHPRDARLKNRSRLSDFYFIRCTITGTIVPPVTNFAALEQRLLRKFLRLALTTFELTDNCSVGGTDLAQISHKMSVSRQCQAQNFSQNALFKRSKISKLSTGTMKLVTGTMNVSILVIITNFHQMPFVLSKRHPPNESNHLHHQYLSIQ